MPLLWSLLLDLCSVHQLLTMWMCRRETRRTSQTPMRMNTVMRNLTTMLVRATKSQQKRSASPPRCLPRWTPNPTYRIRTIRTATPITHLWVCNSPYATAPVQTSPEQWHLLVVLPKLLLLTRPSLLLPLLLRRLLRVLLITPPTTPKVYLTVHVTVRPVRRTAIIPTVPDRSVPIRKKKVQSWRTKITLSAASPPTTTTPPTAAWCTAMRMNKIV
mmetsp:Transcript_19479/g.33777  ORF Transcript_19479/g.33777 Transcript_19479/m.33777 type:complete len:216 (+) Transcript_19479:107-754(+)